MYTADSIAILAYLADRLPTDAEEIFVKAEEGNEDIQVPAISIGEVIYTILKGRDIFGRVVTNEKISIFLDVLEYSRNMFITDLSIEGWRKVLEVNLPELHDRMIVATHLTTNSRAVITDDEEIKKLENIETLW